jgi:hypothetical protein
MQFSPEPSEDRQKDCGKPASAYCYCKFPQKRWMRVQASSSALVAVA